MPGTQGKKLNGQYTQYGEDPFIIGRNEKVLFSAGVYALERVEEIYQSDYSNLV